MGALVQDGTDYDVWFDHVLCMMEAPDPDYDKGIVISVALLSAVIDDANLDAILCNKPGRSSSRQSSLAS